MFQVAVLVQIHSVKKGKTSLRFRLKETAGSVPTLIDDKTLE